MAKKKAAKKTVKKQSKKTAHLAPHQWKPGQSGNPNGHPGGENFKTRLKRLQDILPPESIIHPDDEELKRLAKELRLSVMDIVSYATLREAAKGNIQAAKEINDRTEGKPHQTSENTIKGDGVFQVVLPPEE